MRFLSMLFLGLLIVLSPFKANAIGQFEVVNDVVSWHTPNLTELPSEEAEKLFPAKQKGIEGSRPLGLLAYYEHFDTFTTSPPMEFWLPLEKGAGGLAEIRGREVAFLKNGKRIPLNTSRVPSEAHVGAPYLLSIPVLEVVMVAYPYYFFRKKNNKCFVDVYSSSGEKISTFDFQPTHYLKGNPYLLVSHERDCCSVPTSWTIRLQNMQKGSAYQYTCPEGACGDVILHALGENGPIVLARGIVSRSDGVGFSEQTNITIIGRDGEVMSSGKYVYASTHSPGKSETTPFSVANLLSIDSLGKDGGWLVRFGRKSSKSAFKLKSSFEGPALAVVYILKPTNRALADKETLVVNGKKWGSLPALAVAEPGIQEFSLMLGEKVRKKVVWKVQADQINVFHFEND